MRDLAPQLSSPVRSGEGYVLRETAAGTGNQLLLYFCTESEDLA